MKTSNETSNWAVASVIVSVVVFLIKAWSFKVTGSAAILSDALESTVNIVASLVALFVVRYASKPADEDHPYGHGKAEYFSAAFEGGMIFFASLLIVYESGKALLIEPQLRDLNSGLYFLGIATAFNLIFGYLLKVKAQKVRSEALAASAKHILTDVITTAGVFVGIGLVLLTGWVWLDALVALAVGLQLAYSGFKIVRQSFGALLDEVDPEAVRNLAKVLEAHRTPQLVDIHNLRILRAGRFHHVDAHLVVPSFLDMESVHQIAHEFEKNVVTEYPFDGEIAFHLDPCAQSYCQICQVEACPIRKSEFVATEKWTSSRVTAEAQKSDL